MPRKGQATLPRPVSLDLFEDKSVYFPILGEKCKVMQLTRIPDYVELELQTKVKRRFAKFSQSLGRPLLGLSTG